MNKPEVGDVFGTELLEESDNKRKLKGFHPVVVIENNIDDSSRVMGCSSKNADKDDVKLDIEPSMPLETYARKYQGLVDIENSKLKPYGGVDRKCKNVEDLTSGL